MKKTLLVLAMVLLVAFGSIFAFAACNNTDGNTITMYTEAGFAPYEWMGSNGKITGVDVAIMSQVAENLGMKLNIKDVEFESIPLMVKNGQANSVGAAGMTISDSRKESVDFSHVYASSTIVIISKTKIEAIGDLGGKKVAVQLGTSGDLIMSAAVTADGYSYEIEEDDGSKTPVNIKVSATVTQLNDYSVCRTYLENGNVDAIVMDKLPAEALFAGNKSVYITAANDLIEEDFGIAIKKGDTKMMEAVNEVIDLWLANGKMTQYTEYYTALDKYEKGQGEKPVAPEGLKLSWNC